MTKNITEKLAERIAVLLLKLSDEDDFNAVANEAVDMATLLHRSKADPSWARIPGKPYYNGRLSKVAAKAGIQQETKR